MLQVLGIGFQLQRKLRCHHEQSNINKFWILPRVLFHKILSRIKTSILDFLFACVVGLCVYGGGVKFVRMCVNVPYFIVPTFSKAGVLIVQVLNKSCSMSIIAGQARPSLQYNLLWLSTDRAHFATWLHVWNWFYFNVEFHNVLHMEKNRLCCLFCAFWC